VPIILLLPISVGGCECGVSNQSKRESAYSYFRTTKLFHDDGLPLTALLLSTSTQGYLRSFAFQCNRFTNVAGWDRFSTSPFADHESHRVSEQKPFHNMFGSECPVSSPSGTQSVWVCRAVCGCFVIQDIGLSRSRALQIGVRDLVHFCISSWPGAPIMKI
jgi:hypothetical protein